MSYRTPRSAKSAGVIPQTSDERPSLLLHIARLYRGDVLFRSLVDLTIIGVLVVGAKFEWSNLAATLTPRAPQQITEPAPSNAFPAVVGEQSAGGRAVSSEQRLVHGAGFGDQIIHDLVHPIRIESEAFQHTAEPLQSSLYSIKSALDLNQVRKALDQVRALDDSDPTVAYVKALVLLRIGEDYDYLEVAKLLKRATEKSVYPAYIAYGNMLVDRVNAYEIGIRPKSYLALVDDAGVIHQATREELLAAAALSYERAASFGRGSGARMLGLARARGWGGKRDLIGAVALWRQGAAAGDPLSKHHLARMLQSGSGVQADGAEAERLYRETYDEVPASQVGLALILIPKSIKGDEAAAREALAALDKYETSDRNLMMVRSNQQVEITDNLKLIAYWTHGLYLMQIAPPHLRNPAEAVVKFEQATFLGHTESAFHVGEALRLGTGVSADPACAYGFYLVAQPLNPKKVNPILKQLEAKIGADGISRGRQIAQEIQPKDQVLHKLDGPSVCTWVAKDPKDRRPSFEDVMRNFNSAFGKNGAPLQDPIKQH